MILQKGERTEQIQKLVKELYALDSDVAYEIVIEPQEDTRKNAQNRLMWKWNQTIASYYGCSLDYAHGLMKMTFLLPMYETSTYKDGKPNNKRRRVGEFVRQLINRLTDQKFQVSVCYDKLRTKTLPVWMMADYLTRLDEHWSEQGLYLPKRDDDYYDAMGWSREKPAA